jgi:hypothetical protein
MTHRPLIATLSGVAVLFILGMVRYTAVETH